MSDWTLLSNHGLTLLLLADKPETTTRQLADVLNMTERTAQRIVADLHSANYIEKEKIGRQNRYEVNLKKSLRHPIKKDKTVGNLLTELAA
jgi:DNA-binding MarR family transcriptional regulator